MHSRSTRMRVCLHSRILKGDMTLWMGIRIWGILGCFYNYKHMRMSVESSSSISLHGNTMCNIWMAWNDFLWQLSYMTIRMETYTLVIHVLKIWSHYMASLCFSHVLQEPPLTHFHNLLFTVIYSLCGKFTQTRKEIFLNFFFLSFSSGFDLGGSIIWYTGHYCHQSSQN